MKIPFLTKHLEKKNMEYQNRLLKKQVQEVQNIYMTMRGWRHDYHNHLQSMKAYLEMGQYGELENYLGLLEADLDHEYITTKRGNHGHGLRRINLVVEKYQGYVNRQNEPGVFVTEVMLPL